MSRERFAEAMRGAIVSLPHTVRAMLRIVEDPDISDEGRASVAGALLHWLSDHNSIPGVRGVLAYLDDVLVMRLVLERVQDGAPEVMERHREAAPEALGQLAAELEASRAYLGGSMSVLEEASQRLSRIKHKGHNAAQCIEDEEAANWLYDEVQEALVELDIDEEEVAREIKGVDRIIKALHQRA